MISDFDLDVSCDSSDVITVAVWLYKCHRNHSRCIHEKLRNF